MNVVATVGALLLAATAITVTLLLRGTTHPTPTPENEKPADEQAGDETESVAEGNSQAIAVN
jgi:DHA2 family multidrug resistance protein-like MFS transporter